ncbi:MAG TPA: hypothetical protein VG939_18855 [Caulobacteraceae bacterium]|nr:hypothetical protein [Caulobacteraceae bacterium]
MTTAEQTAGPSRFDTSRVVARMVEFLRRRGFALAALSLVIVGAPTAGLEWIEEAYLSTIVPYDSVLGSVALGELRGLVDGVLSAVMLGWVVPRMAAAATGDAGARRGLSIGRFGLLVAGSLVVTFCVSGALCLLVVPGVLLSLAWAMWAPVLVTETPGIGEALNRSVELTRGHRGAMFLAFLAVFVAYGIALLFAAKGSLVNAGRDPVYRFGLFPAILAGQYAIQAVLTSSFYVELVTFKDGGFRSHLASVFD